MNSPLSDAQMREALQRAFNLGREYFPLAMSEYDSARERSAEVLTAFKNMVEDTSSAFLAGSAEPVGYQCSLENGSDGWHFKLVTKFVADEHVSLGGKSRPLYATPIPADSDRSGATDAHQRNGLAWAVHRWRDEVSNRPMVNVHRRSLDDTWRQVIRYFGGDPDKLVGPSHDAIYQANGNKL